MRLGMGEDALDPVFDGPEPGLPCRFVEAGQP
jgi:hypothetical protein